MNIKSLSAATIGLSLLASSNSHAELTFLQPNLVEAGPADVFAELYGGSFTESGLDFTNGETTLRRVADDRDEFWTGTFSAKIVARFSGFTQALGALSKGKYQDLLEASGVGFDQPVEEKTVTLDSGVWVRFGDSGTHASAPQFNEDGRDHLISYYVESDNASPVWVLFWEDLDLDSSLTKGRSASDFNDLVVMVREVEIPGAPIAVPLPGAFVAGLATLGLGGLIFRKRLVASR
jgi:hypothetical protein